MTGDRAAVKAADLVILAVKPQMAKTAVDQALVDALPEKANILSIMGSYEVWPCSPSRWCLAIR